MDLNKISASDLNRQVTLESYSYLQNNSGGLDVVLAEQITTWANIVQLSGGDVVNQGQDKNFSDFKITIRYRPQITENWDIIYEGMTLKIKQMQVDNPAYKRYIIIYASTTLQPSSWS